MTANNLMNLQQVNDMTRDAFVAAMGSVFEYAPWVAESAWEQRPFADSGQLHEAMLGLLRDSSRERILEFLAGHEDAQVTPAAIDAMTPDSRLEHISAGLHTLSPDQQTHVARMVREYRDRFGFACIIALRGRTADEFIALLEMRVASADLATEIDITLIEVGKITWMRLDRMVG